MRKSVCVASVTAFVLAGCAAPGPAPAPKPAASVTLTKMGTPDPTAPNVYVVSGPGKKQKVVVDQEPLVFFVGTGGATITWTIQTPGYEFRSTAPTGALFAAKALSGSSSQIVKCAIKNPQQYTCDNLNSAKTVHPYSMAVVPTGGSTPISTDPNVVNE